MRLIGYLLIGCTLGGLGGVAFGGFQILLAEKSFVAEAVIKERLTFNDIWLNAPPALQHAEVRRPFLNKLAADKKSRCSHEWMHAEMVAGLLNEWMRFVDNVLFKFVIDLAYQSSNVANSGKRYARVEEGFQDGLGQRAVVLRAIGNSAEGATNALQAWRNTIEQQAVLGATEATKAWLSRKALGLEAFSDGGSGLHVGMDAGQVNLLATQFRAAAGRISSVTPYLSNQSEIYVEEISHSPWKLLLMWSMLGIGAGGILGVSFWGRRRK